MRFRLATTGNGTAPSFGEGFRALGMLPMLRAQAAEDGQRAQAEMAARAAQQRQAEAHASLYSAQADAERTQLQRGSLGELLKSAAMQSGVPLHQVGEASQYLQSGQLAPKYEMPADLPGPTMPKPQYADPALGAKIMQTLGLTQQALAVGDKSVENIAKATGAYQDQGITDAAVAAAGRGDDMSMSRLNAVRGKKEFTPYAAVGNTGTALNQVTGEQGVSNAGLRTLFGDVQGANILKDKAAASSSYASAGAAKALEEQRRAVTAAGPGAGKPPSGYQWTTGADGEARLTPIPGGPKDPANNPGKPLPASAAKGYLENFENLRRAEKALSLIEGKTVDGATGDPEATGLKGYLPNQLLNRIDKAGVDTRAAIADLGSLVIHDRSGAAVTAAEFPRLAPFIPTEKDDAQAAQKKLKQFVTNYRATIQDAENFYRASGYNVPSPSTAAAPRAAPAPAQGGAQRISSDAEYNALPSGAVFIGPDGKQRRKP